MLIILLSGSAGSGKTTAATFLAKTLLPFRPHAAAFSDAVKAEACERYGFPRRLCYSSESKATVIETEAGPMTVADILSGYERDMRTAHGDDWWARKVVDRIHTVGAEGPWIIHDCTSLIEAQVMKRSFPEARLVIIHIERPGVPRTYAPDPAPVSHVIVNDGARDDLERNMAACIRQYL